jgi:hypothetical protein
LPSGTRFESRQFDDNCDDAGQPLLRSIGTPINRRDATAWRAKGQRRAALGRSSILPGMLGEAEFGEARRNGGAATARGDGLAARPEPPLALARAGGVTGSSGDEQNVVYPCYPPAALLREQPSVLAPTQAESGEADAEQDERGGLGNRCRRSLRIDKTSV